MNITTTTEATPEQQTAIAMSQEILSNSQDINNILTTSGTVKAVFHTHFADMATNEFGIADLICRILRERCPFNVKYDKFAKVSPDPLDARESLTRKGMIIESMFGEEIVNEVHNRFTAGSVRYPKETILAYLSVNLFKAGRVGKIQLTGKEDKNRTSCKPRVKWFFPNV